jgi:hypothetical protein
MATAVPDVRWTAELFVGAHPVDLCARLSFLSLDRAALLKVCARKRRDEQLADGAISAI